MEFYGTVTLSLLIVLVIPSLLYFSFIWILFVYNYTKGKELITLGVTYRELLSSPFILHGPADTIGKSLFPVLLAMTVSVVWPFIILAIIAYPISILIKKTRTKNIEKQTMWQTLKD